MFNLLLQRGASPTARTSNGDTVLTYAVMVANKDMVNAILNCGVDPRDNHGAVPILELAMKNQEKAVIDMLQSKFVHFSVFFCY